MEPGTKLGQYEILDRLGAGGMGEVWRARDMHLGRDVAIKLLLEGVSADPDRLARFEREARVLAALNHPNVATLFGFERDDSGSTPFLVMELVEGETLAERIDRGPVPFSEARRIFIQIAEGLEAAHEQGIVHRDLKPANLKLSSDAQGGPLRVKVLDFGLAKPLDSGEGRSPDLSQTPTLTAAATRRGEVMGTAAYMSPEQARGETIDKRTDVWAFGACLFETLAGQTPFQGETASHTMVAILDHEPDWHALPEETPAEIQRLLRRCLTKDAHDRLHDIADARIALREVSTQTGSFVAPASSEKAAPVAQQKMSPPGRRGLLLSLGSLIFLSALIAYFVGSSVLRPSAVSNANSLPNTATDTAKVLPFGGRPAIAVLPFDNLSPDPEQAFFADGLAEDLITRLSTWRSFPVIARNSSFQHRGGNLDLKRVSTELGARYLLAGSVRRAGDRIRVTAQLIDAPTDQNVWAQTYDRAITDLFTLQDEISSTIAASLVGDLTRAEGERARRRGTENLEAWSLYQLGMQHAERFTLEEYGEARRFFDRAVESDPRFATALAQSALSTVMEIMLGSGDVREDMVSAAFDSARRAVALDARDPTAHAALGGAYLVAGDPKNGIDSTQRAVDLNPSMPEAWIWLGWANVLAGNPEPAISASERAQRLDPQGRYMVWIYDNLSVAYWEVGRYEEGLELARQLVATNPTYFTGYAYIAMNAVALGQLDEARAAIASGRRVRPDLSLALIQGYFGVSRPAFDARRNDALRQAGLE